jgi:hypothetical protein
MATTGQHSAVVSAVTVHGRNGWGGSIILPLVLSMIFLQKIGFTIGEGSFGVNVALLWIGLGALALSNQLVIDLSRFLSFGALLALMALSIVLSLDKSRWSALAIFFAMFAGFVFRLPASEEFALRALRLFQRSMVLIAGIVILQQLLQIAIAPGVRLNIEDFIPNYLLYPGFAYIRPVAWNSLYTVPNGFFLLEPSTVSGYLAAALVSELVWFRSYWRIAIFGAALLAGMALTGLFAIILSAPFWIRRASMRTMIALGLLIGPMLVAALLAGFLDPLVNRGHELSSETSSAHARLVAPMRSIWSQIGDPAHWITGLGAGSSPKLPDVVQWPFSKLLHEYGLATALLFHVFLFQAVLIGNHFRAVTIVFLLPYLFFGGGFVAHASVMPLLLLGPLFLVFNKSPYGSVIYAAESSAHKVSR